MGKRTWRPERVVLVAYISEGCVVKSRRSHQFVGITTINVRSMWEVSMEGSHTSVIIVFLFFKVWFLNLIPKGHKRP
jgi:hypothetical protein